MERLLSDRLATALTCESMSLLRIHNSCFSVSICGGHSHLDEVVLRCSYNSARDPYVLVVHHPHLRIRISLPRRPAAPMRHVFVPHPNNQRRSDYKNHYACREPSIELRTRGQLSYKLPLSLMETSLNVSQSIYRA